MRRQGFRTLRGAGAVAAVISLGACVGGLDLDLRSDATLNTSEAARAAVSPRPMPDNRGIISYPNYQVVVAARGETVDDVAGRLGLDGDALARYNGLSRGVALRGGETIVLPTRVAEPSPATGAIATGPIRPARQVDVATLAGAAIERADRPSGINAVAQSGPEPGRHRVGPGETVYSIAQSYGVPVESLADWNGLGPDLALREGQFLLIPAVDNRLAALAPQRDPAARPGQGSTAPRPPSAARPLPDEQPEEVAAAAADATPASPELSKEQTATSDTGKLILPVSGRIARPFQKGQSDGVGFAAPAGSAVLAADSGTVAAITRDTDQVPIVVVRHEGNLLTVYAGVADLVVGKGDAVERGQRIASVRPGNPSILHFEVREGFESVDPMAYFN